MNRAEYADNRRNPRPSPNPESGVALIEFAFVLPILLVLAMGMLDFGRAFHTKSLLDQAAREGARVAVVTSPDVDIVESRVNAVLASGGIAPTSVTVDGPDAANMVTVTVNASSLSREGIGSWPVRSPFSSWPWRSASWRPWPGTPG
jgi:hypothetical protein